MDKKLNVEEIEIYKTRIKELFKEFATEEACCIWGDTFEIDDIDKNQIFVSYSGNLSIKMFKKQCERTLLYCADSVMGGKCQIKIYSAKDKKSKLNSKAKNNIKAFKFFVAGMFFVCIASAVIIVLGNYIGNRNFRETFYSTSNIKLDNALRVIQISDIHGVSYGKNNERLIDRIEALKPDIIICTGDIIDSVEEDSEYAVALATELAKIAPSYYIYGNNEVESVYDFPFDEKELDEKFGFDKTNRDETALLQLEDSFEQRLEDAGINVLKNEMDTVKVKGMNVDVYGVLNSNPSSFWSYSGKSFLNYLYENPENIKITAVHEPFIFETFQQEYWGDLMVCGHTHGGLIRVPLLGPLYTHEGGLFPERSDFFVYGRYDVAGSPLIVSGGLENKNVFRVNNEPELVVIDINKF